MLFLSYRTKHWLLFGFSQVVVRVETHLKLLRKYNSGSSELSMGWGNIRYDDLFQYDSVFHC